MPRLLSVNVGLPRDVTWNGKTVRTSVWKSPVDGRRIVRKLDIDGDAQADLAGHGGEHRAVFVYQMDSYHYWESFLGRNDFTFGQFGHTCMTGLIAGSIIYNPEPLERPAPGNVLVCCSQPNAGVTLDL